MNSYFILVCLFLISLPATAQNYYVTTFKGKITYQNKELKKRDKIRIKGELRFSSKEDWVKVAGPGGIYTLTPEKTGPGGNEFITALREELFPKVRLRGSFANSVGFNGSRPDCLGISHYINYFDGTPFPLQEELNGFEDDLRYVFFTEQGVVTLPVKVTSGVVIFHRKNWRGVPPLADRPYSYSEVGFPNEDAGLVVINDHEAFTAAMDTAQTFDELGLDFNSCAYYPNEAMMPDDYPGREVDSIKVSNYAFPDVSQPMATGTLLSFFRPDSFLDRKAFDRDLRFLIRKTKPEDAEDFLHNMQFDDYISETYGYPGLPVPLSAYLETLIEKNR